MRHPKIIIAGIGLAAVAAAGGVTVASAGSSAASPAISASSASPATAATVHTVTASVAGRPETVLVSGHGLPLYYYRPDTATRSLVTGNLAQLWPPLTSGAPTGTGVNGKLAVLSDIHGQQVTYQGHPLYTFAGDRPGQVTGQGVQDFFVATPGVAVTGAAVAGRAPAGTVPAAPSGGGPGY
jgi:predicted lipoprotein with Yx(FWY)xxD motif